jgi:8-oxo-dGTP diphosphatase
MSDFDSPTSTACPSPIKDLHVVAAVIHFNGKILAAKRLAGGPSGFKWEFPGGKVEAGEVPQQALAREIREELGMEILVRQEIGTFSTVIGDRRINLQCFHCVAETALVNLVAHSEVAWCLPSRLRDFDWALPDIPVLEVIIGSPQDIGL